MNDDKKDNKGAFKDNKSLRTEDPAASPHQEHETFDEIPDLDGDGMIGYTGGNYGDTSYTGGDLNQPQPGPVEEAPKQEDAGETEDEDKE